MRVGLFVLVGIALLVVAVFYVTSVENPLASKYRLKTYFPEVAGLAIGAPVSLDGIDVGNVEDIQVNPAIGGPAADKARNIIVTLHISSKYQKNIRADSIASPETQGLLGDRFVHITRGFTGKELQDGDELTGKPNPGIDELVAEGTELESHMDGLIDNVQGMVTDVRAGKGTLGQAVTNSSMYDHADAALNKFNAMLSSIQSGQGTIGQFYATDATSKKVNAFLDHGTNIEEAIEQQKGSLGKFIYDPSVHTQITQFLNKSNGLMDDVKNGKGTISKLLYDDSLFATYKQAGTNLANATAKLDANQGTLGKMFNDPKLYDNLTGLTGDLRLFMTEFEKNPKKYLQIQLKIF